MHRLFNTKSAMRSKEDSTATKLNERFKRIFTLMGRFGVGVNMVRYYHYHYY